MSVTHVAVPTLLLLELVADVAQPVLVPLAAFEMSHSCLCGFVVSLLASSIYEMVFVVYIISYVRTCYVRWFYMYLENSCTMAL